MNEEKSKNSFSRYVREGDWLGYKNEVSKQSNGLSRELEKKVPTLAKVNKLLLSASIGKRIIGNIILLAIFSLPTVLCFSENFQNYPILRLLCGIFPILITHIPMVYILTNKIYKKNNKVVNLVWYMPPTLLCLLLRHLTYISIILWKNKKEAFLITLSIVGTVWGIYAFNTFIVKTLIYENIKHYEVENMYIVLLILIFLSAAVAGLNVLLLMVGLNKKCGVCGQSVNNWNSRVNNSLLIITCFFISFLSVFVSLIGKTSNPYIYPAAVIFITFVFLLEKLLFGNNNQKLV